MADQSRGKSSRRKPSRPRTKQTERRAVEKSADPEPEPQLEAQGAIAEDMDDSMEDQSLVENQPVADLEPEPPPRSAPPSYLQQGPRVMPEEEFVIQVFYDRSVQQFQASCLEFPDLKVQGTRREEVVEEMSQKIGDELEMMRREGRQLPIPFAARNYPDKLEVRISKSLYRRLDILSRQDRVPMDQLVSELLTQSLNRRPGDSGRGQERRPQNPNQNQKGQGHGGHHNRRGGGGGRGQQRYHDTMGKSDNFLEYVRSLEKGGGFKKR